MIAIFPSLTRSVVLFDFLEYELPKRYLISDLKKAMDAIPEMAYENNFPLNLENLFSAVVVFLLPTTHNIDTTKIEQNHPQNYEICVEYGQKLTDVLVQKYTYHYNQGRIFWFDTEMFNDFALVLAPKALENIDYTSSFELKKTRLFLHLCSNIKLKKPSPGYTKNTEAAIKIAKLHILGLFGIFGIEPEQIDPNLLNYLQEHAINRKTAAALVGMVVTLDSPTLEQFEKFGDTNFVISEYDSNIGSLLFHVQRSDSFYQITLENAFKVGLLRYSESTQETTATLFKLLPRNKQVHKLPSLFVELMVTATPENHNAVRAFLVEQNILPNHTKIDVNNLIRLDATLLQNLKDTDLLVAVAIGLDVRAESVTMH